MSTCTGGGDCIQQCGCRRRTHIQMIGGNNQEHRYCRITQCPFNCTLIECYNYRLCGQKRPQRILDSHNGMCMDCAIMIGCITVLDLKDECPICMETKDMIQIVCKKHNICLSCWLQMSEKSGSYPVKCPMCREGIWK